MSGLPKEIWRARFWGAAFALQERGFKVMNPADTIIARHPWLYKIVGYRFTLWYDLRLLKKCDHIYMVGLDWQQSRGARLERLKAREWSIPELHNGKPKGFSGR